MLWVLLSTNIFIVIIIMGRHCLSLLVVVALLHYHHLVIGVAGQLRVGFYSRTCPSAESVVSSVVRGAVQGNPRNVAMLLRLHFHDCFVEGCDGSILIDTGSERDERKAFGHQGVEGFEVVEQAKAKLESVCPGVVSCADIVALMARDAVFLGKGSRYEVPTGRRDGRVSNVDLAANMPEADDSIDVLKSRFRDKGLSDQDLVLLTAAHSIGTTACFFMQNRLYSFNGTNTADPAISPRCLTKLRAQCPPGSNSERVPLDPVTANVMDDQILRNIKFGMAVLPSDARLYDDSNTKQITDSHIGPNGKSTSFLKDFGAAMVRMGRIGVKTGNQGEIRRVCSRFN